MKKKSRNKGSIIIEGWICRDKYLNPCIGSNLLFATEHPKLDEDAQEYIDCGPYIPLKREFYPQVTFESGPVPATMVITIDEKL